MDDTTRPGPTATVTAKEAVALAALFAHATRFRVRGIQADGPRLGDQARDWAIALGPAGSLFLVGTPSTAGGHTLGPFFYRLIWISRVTIGPFFDNLPHAGGIGLSAVHSKIAIALVLDGVSPRDIHAAFVRQPTAPTFLSTVLGSRLDPESGIEAQTPLTGHVVYRSIAP